MEVKILSPPTPFWRPSLCLVYAFSVSGSIIHPARQPQMLPVNLDSSLSSTHIPHDSGKCQWLYLQNKCSSWSLLPLPLYGHPGPRHRYGPTGLHSRCTQATVVTAKWPLNKTVTHPCLKPSTLLSVKVIPGITVTTVFFSHLYHLLTFSHAGLLALSPTCL